MNCDTDDFQCINRQRWWRRVRVRSLVCVGIVAAVSLALLGFDGMVLTVLLALPLIVGLAVCFMRHALRQALWAGLATLVLAGVGTGVVRIVIDLNTPYATKVSANANSLWIVELICMSVLTALFGIAFAYVTPQDSAEQESRIGRCPMCLYDLTGLPEGQRCPECGGTGGVML